MWLTAFLFLPFSPFARAGERGVVEEMESVRQVPAMKEESRKEKGKREPVVREVFIGGAPNRELKDMTVGSPKDFLTIR